MELGAEGLSKQNSWKMPRVSLTHVDTGLQTIYQVMDYAHSLKERSNHRFHDLQTEDVFKRIKLLDTSLWPIDKDTLIKFGKEELSSVQKRLEGQFIKHNVSFETLKTELRKLKLFWLSNSSHLP